MRLRLPLVPCLLLTLWVCLSLLYGAEALARQPFGSTDEAIAALKKGDIARRVRAANQLARCRRGPERAKAVRALERTLFDSQPVLRRAALNGLVALDARAAGGSVVRLLQIERDVTVLPAALIALGALQVRGADRVLVERASHLHPAVRAATLTAAGDLGGPANHRLVLNSFQMAGAEDADWLVRSSAMLALAKIGGPEDLDLIQRVYRSSGGQASWLARSALARAVAALHPRPQRILETMIQDPDIRVAVTAATGMARAGLLDVLALYLRSGVPQIRAAAVGGVRQAGLVAWLPRLRHMARWDRSREVRWAVAVALFAMEDPAGDELMIEGLKAHEITVWAAALAHLSRRTGASYGRNAKAWRAELKKWRSR